MVNYQRQIDENPNNAPDVHTPIIHSPKKKCFGDGFKVLVIGCIIFAAAITIGLFVDLYYLRKPALRAAAVTSAPECTKIANDILVKNDNPIDAAIGAMFCLAVVRPDQCSLASGGYMLIHSGDEDNSLDFQFAAPTIDDTYQVAIPGLLSGLQAAHELYGSMPFSKLIQPSIELASQGFVVTNSTAANLKTLPDDVQKKFFVQGKLVEGGEELNLTTLSQTLTKISNGTFSIADDIAKTLTSTNGSISAKDFEGYKPLWKKPLVLNMKDKQVVTTDSPSAGVILLASLNVFNQFAKVNSSKSFSVMSGVLEFMLPKIHVLQDPAFDPTQEKRKEMLLSSSDANYYAQEIASLLGMPQIVKKRVKRGTKADDEALKTDSYATVTIVNLKGDAVSVVSSLGNVFGSKIVTDSGIVLNNGLSAFSTSFGKLNTFQPSKRPLSYSAPAFIVDGKVISSLAPSTGKEGLSSVIQVIKNMLVDEMGDEQAVAYPRVFVDASSRDVYIEGQRLSTSGLEDDVISLLKSQFVNVQDVPSIGNVDIAFKSKSTHAVVDTR